MSPKPQRGCSGCCSSAATNEHRKESKPKRYCTHPKFKPVYFQRVSEYKSYTEQQRSSSHYFEPRKAGVDKFPWIPETLTRRLFQPLCAVEITLTFLDTIFRGFWRQLSIASVIESLAEEMWWKMTRLLDTEWEHNGVAKKGLADTTSENAK